jgi:apolipoprotein N-acyltransferase
MRRFVPILLPVLSGLLLAIPFLLPQDSPAGSGLLAFVWLIPLLAALHRGPPSASSGFRKGWLAGASFFGATLWWIGHVTTPGMLALVAYLALYPALWAAAASTIRPHRWQGKLAAALALGGLWCGLEWLRGMLLSGFPWNGAAAPLVSLPGLRDWAPFLGVTGTAFFPITLQCLAFPLPTDRNLRGALAATAALAFAPLTFPYQPTDRFPPLKVAIVQPNVSMQDKMFGDDAVQQRRYDELIETSLATLASQPDLIVWPESALPGWFHDAASADAFAALLSKKTHLITGCDSETIDGAAPDDWNPRNCMALVSEKSDNFQLHAKVRLVPFGEFIPFRRQLPFLESMLGHLIPRDFARGTSLLPLTIPGPAPAAQIIPLVCFEDTIGSHARQFIRDVPQIMVNVTNDNWFHHSPAATIHALNARWRCLELRRPMIRCANTGFSCAISPAGHLTASLPPFTRGSLLTEIAPSASPPTFFARHGNVFPASAGAAALAALFLLRPRRPAP